MINGISSPHTGSGQSQQKMYHGTLFHHQTTMFLNQVPMKQVAKRSVTIYSNHLNYGWPSRLSEGDAPSSESWLMNCGGSPSLNTKALAAVEAISDCCRVNSEHKHQQTLRF